MTYVRNMFVNETIIGLSVIIEFFCYALFL